MDTVDSGAGEKYCTVLGEVVTVCDRKLLLGLWEDFIFKS